MANTITQIGRPEVYEYETPEHKVIETLTFYNYFCTKMTCFFAFFRRYADHAMKCPCCGESKNVCFKEK